MGAASIDCLRHHASQNRTRRWSRTLTLALSALLAVSTCALPATSAFAEQVLELPQAAAQTPSADAPAEAEAEPKPRRQAMTPMPAGLGSIDDYENQGESSYPAGIASPPPNLRVDPNGPNRNREGLVNDVILGALAIGLFAMEVHAAHQHRHR
jgi:hypothetical protein